jgi:hypothetical protein
MSPGRRFLRTNSLGLFFGLIFLLALVGQFFAGLVHFNDTQAAEGLYQISWLDYLTSSDFATDVTENWQSEYLQFLLYITATVWFVQHGSPESKQVEDAGLQDEKSQKIGPEAESDSPEWAKTGGWRTFVFSWSLTALMGLIFLVSWLAQSVAGWGAFNETRLQQMQDPLSWASYLGNADFWSRTLQNWQSEFLAVGSMAVFSVYLRQRGSAESKPVGEPHDSTGVSS